jgi:hypothetical protein
MPNGLRKLKIRKLGRKIIAEIIEDADNPEAVGKLVEISRKRIRHERQRTRSKR